MRSRGVLARYTTLCRTVQLASGFVSLGPAGLCSLASLAASPMVMALNPAPDLNLTLGPVEKETAWHHRAG